MNRRTFLKRVAVGAVAIPLVGVSLRSRVVAQHRLRVGDLLADDGRGGLRRAETGDRIVGVATGVGEEFVSYGFVRVRCA